MTTPAQRARIRARQGAAMAAPPPRITPRRGSVESLTLTAQGRRWPVGAAIDGDTAWEMTTEGAATVTLPVRSPNDSLLRVLTDEALIQRDGITVEVDGVSYALASVSSDGTGLYTLTFEDQVAWRLRQFTKFLAATRATTTRAGFVRRLVAEASAPPRERMRWFIPELRDVQPVARGG
ncbi:hypothetical protein [Miltoncostaea marina]|uniref:hypothetical protein n=1 Tax=Miltoncostaea marina TaxID=2843215 RepID=UPI001C3DE2BC|nr:hypothetical protein [Miltoncostaea marina]